MYTWITHFRMNTTSKDPWWFQTTLTYMPHVNWICNVAGRSLRLRPLCCIVKWLLEFRLGFCQIILWLVSGYPNPSKSIEIHQNLCSSCCPGRRGCFLLRWPPGWVSHMVLHPGEAMRSSSVNASLPSLYRCKDETVLFGLMWLWCKRVVSGSCMLCFFIVLPSLYKHICKWLSNHLTL